MPFIAQAHSRSCSGRYVTCGDSTPLRAGDAEIQFPSAWSAFLAADFSSHLMAAVLPKYPARDLLLRTTSLGLDNPFILKAVTLGQPEQTS